MRLESVEVKTLDGLNGPLAARGLVPGVNVVLGPNASGKSSLVRAVRAALYPDPKDDRVEVKMGVVTDDGTPLVAHRLGPRTAWLRSGREAQAPRLPEQHLLGAYVIQLEDLVGAREESAKKGRETVDERITKSLQRELTGGVDLAALKAGIKAPPKGIRELKKQLQEADEEVSRLRKELAELRRQEEMLGADQAALDGHKSVADRGALVPRARELADALERAARAQAELDSLPRALGAFQPGDDERVDDLESSLRRELDDVRAKRLELQDALEVARGSRVPAGLTAAAAKDHLAIAEELCDLAQRLERIDEDLAAARARARETWREMGGVPGHEGLAQLDRQSIDEAAAAAFAVQAEAQREAHLARQLAEVEGRLSGEEGGPGPQRLKALDRAALELTRWLEAPPPAAVVPGWAWGVAFALAAAAVLAAMLAPAPWPAVAAGVVLAWLVVALLVSRRSLGEAPDDAGLIRALQDVGLEPTEEVTHDVAAGLLSQVVEEASSTRRWLEARQEEDELARTLRAELAEAQERRGEAAELLAGLRERLGFAAQAHGDAGFVQWLARAREHAEAVTDVRELEGRRAHLEEKRLEACAKVLSHLLAVGADADPEAPAALLRRRCQEVCDAVSARDGAAVTAARLEREIAAALERARDVARQLGAMATRLGFDVPGPVGVEDVADAWPTERVLALVGHVKELARRLLDFEGAADELKAARSQEQLCLRALERDPELLAAAEAGDRASIEKVAIEAKEAAEQRDNLNEAIGALKDKVARAKRERWLESALAKAQRARDELEAHRSARLEQAAAEFLVADVEGEHEAVTKPAALERAKDWFARVTHGDFELTFERDGSGAWRFGAEDRRAGADGRRLRLEELSTGTRAQLLISARLAYAITLEEAGGEPVERLPFVLDEALTTSDPARFLQVAGAVLDIVKASGRQFVYLSARPEDAELWRRAAASRPGVPLQVIDLAEGAAMAAAD